MKQRLRKVIDYVADGKVIAFAENMGWLPQYVNNMLNAKGGVGLKPIITILEKYPEIDARWLLLGEGNMIADVSKTARDYLYQLLSIEKESPKMSVKELQKIVSEMTLSLARLQGYFDALKNSKN